MNRIEQLSPENATGNTAQLYRAVESKLGFVPNLMRVLGNSSAALEGYLNFNGALTGGVLPAKVREQIALTVAEINGCGYCLSAHTLLGGKAGLSPEDIAAARGAEAPNDQVDAILKLARSVALSRGQVTDEDVAAARSVGLDDAQIVETVAHVAVNVLTNYVNNVARTVIDFPEVKPAGTFAAATV